MSTRVKLPPTPLAKSIVETLLVKALGLAPLPAAQCRFTLEPGSSLAVAELQLTSSDLHAGLVNALKDGSPANTKPPLVRGSQNDSGSLAAMLGKNVSLAKQNIPDLYRELVEVLRRSSPSLVERALGDVKIVVAQNGVFRVCLGGCEYRVPRIIQSDAFYELGRFGGFSDRRGGQPQAGRVEYRAGKVYDVLLFAGLLATHLGAAEDVTTIHIFATLSVEPGVTLEKVYAQQVAQVYSELLREARSVGPSAWIEDYEGIRLASLLGAISKAARLGMEAAGNLKLVYTFMASTGRRAYTQAVIEVSFNEVSGYARSLERLASELGFESVAELADLLRVVLVSVLRLASRRGESQQRIHELWLGLKRLAYAALEGGRHALLDEVYRALRLLSDAKAGLLTELAGETKTVSEMLDGRGPSGRDAIRKLFELARRITGA